MKIGRQLRVSLSLCVLMLGCFSSAAFAVDGVVLIDQVRALAGNVTPGDAPGFPVTISIRGSYRLSSGLFVPADTDGIVITAAEGVSIDLNGFQITGNGGEFGVGNVGGAAHGMSVRNGSVTGFREGVSIGASASEVRDVRAFENSSAGIQVSGNVLVTGNSVARNGVGIKAFEDALVSGNAASLNDIGIETRKNSMVSGNTTGSNRIGIKVVCPSGLVGNTSSGNFELNIVEENFLDPTPCSRANNHPKP